MKKIVMLSVVVALVLAGATARGKSLSVGDLPPAAQSLLSSVFSGVEVQQVKKNFKDYQVKLAKNGEEAIDVFYCSPYLRSMATIEQAAAFFEKEIHI